MEINVERTEIFARVEDALEAIRPFLKADGGDVELLDIDDEDVVHIKLLGACGTCDISHITMKAGIEDSIRRVFPQLRAVTAKA